MRSTASRPREPGTESIRPTARGSRSARPGEWRKAIAAAIHKGQLFTVEASGVFSVTDLATGWWKRLGEPDCANTVVIVSAGDGLFTFERGGAAQADPLRDKLALAPPASELWASFGFGDLDLDQPAIESRGGSIRWVPPGLAAD